MEATLDDKRKDRCLLRHGTTEHTLLALHAEHKEKLVLLCLDPSRLECNDTEIIPETSHDRVNVVGEVWPLSYVGSSGFFVHFPPTLM